MMIAPKSPEGDFAAHRQNTPGQSLYRAGIHLQRKELDEQIKTQLAKIGFEL